MPELTDLQADILRVLNENCSGLFAKECSMQSKEINKQLKSKPSGLGYISTTLRVLQKKGKIKIKNSYKVGVSGKIRTITIL